jgi:integrase
MARKSTGIEVRHGRTCKSHDGGGCNCTPTFRAWAWSPRDKKKIRRTFASLEQAKLWRSDAYGQVKRGALREPTRRTMREAADELLAGMRSGTIRTRSGDVYKPSAIRGYEAALRDRIVPVLGPVKIGDVQRRDAQRIADQMLAEGRDPSTIRNALMPLRVIYRRAIEDGDVTVNPTANLRLPAVRGRRDRIASPDEASKLLAALPESDRALWATALFAGLRLGELQALRWSDVDLASGLIRVQRSYDEKARVFVTPKSRAGERKVPIAAVLRDELVAHKRRVGWPDGLVFGRTTERPFDGSSCWRRDRLAWKRASLSPLGFHEARHTFASLMIAAGVNAKALSTYMGHSSVTITYDRYGHLMPGNEDEAAGLLDAYLERANTAARLAQLGQAA